MKLFVVVLIVLLTSVSGLSWGQLANESEALSIGAEVGSANLVFPLTVGLAHTWRKEAGEADEAGQGWTASATLWVWDWPGIAIIGEGWLNPEPEARVGLSLAPRVMFPEGWPIPLVPGNSYKIQWGVAFFVGAYLIPEREFIGGVKFFLEFN